MYNAFALYQRKSAKRTDGRIYHILSDRNASRHAEKKNTYVHTLKTAARDRQKSAWTEMSRYSAFS